MSINEEYFTIYHRNLRILEKISQEGDVLESREVLSVAAITQGEMREEALRNSLRGDTIHPGRDDWAKKVKHLDPVLKEKTLNLLVKYKEQFWLQGFLPPIKDVEYSIQYKGPPFRDHMIPLTQEQRDCIIPIFEDQVEQGILGEVTEDVEKLDYVSNMFLKVESDKMRPCINYRKLNQSTVKTNMPIPNKETMLARLAGADRYITMDAKSAYNQLPVEEASQKYMVFVVPGRDGHPRYFYPKRSNFGSSNMPGEFQRLSGGVFEAANAADGVYIDDVTIKCMADKDNEALAKLEEVLRRAKDKGVTFAFKKTHLFEEEVKILGEILNKDGRRPNPARIRALKNWPVPRTRGQLRSFLGLYNFLAPLKRHATAPPIVALQKFTNTSIKYDKVAVVEPFEEAKTILCKWLLLHAYDPKLETFVLTDSSDSGMGAVLMQVTKYGLRAIAVCSKRWPTRKKEYAAHVKEGMALVTGMRRFEHLLKHTNVTMVTDSENTVDLFTNPDWNQVPSLWLRWRRYLAQSFRVSILHIPGKLNIAADVLSRQTYTVAASWAHEETFFSPLMRSIYDEQQKDEEILDIIESLKQKSDPPKKLPNKYYVMEGGLLKQVHFKFGKQIVIPKSLVPTILYLEHDVPLKGHPGEAYMRIAVKQHYCWRGIDKDVHDYVKSCKGCQLAKAKLDRTAISNAIRRTSSIFSVFSMDLIDMNSISASYRYIMVLMDYYSSFILLTNLRDKKATSILKAMWDCFTLFGPPEALLSDRGREFVNKLAARFSEETGVQHVLTYAYRPQANGRNERSHAVIQNTLRIFSESKPASWHHYTARLQYMFNTRAKPETGISPYQILFGLKPRSLHNTSPFLEYNHAEMKNIRETLNQVVQSHQLKQLQARATPPRPAFEVGDKVILNREFPRRAKRYFPAMGPYEVTGKVGTTGYHLRHMETGNAKENVSRAHLYAFTEREGGSAVPQITQNKEQNDRVTEAQQEATESLALDMNEAKEEEVELQKTLEADAKSATQDESVEPPSKKKRRALERLGTFNVPTVINTLKEEPEVGNMVVIKQEGAARIGEVIEIKEEEVSLHWYGSTTTRNLPRSRWKLYPGWETVDGTIEYVASHAGGVSGNKPATCDVKQNEIFLTFNRFTIKSELPADVLKKIEKLSL